MRSQNQKPQAGHLDSRGSRFRLGLPETGSAFFFNAFVLTAILFVFSTRLPEPLSLLVALSLPLSIIFLLLSAAFYIWERRLHRQLRGRFPSEV